MAIPLGQHQTEIESNLSAWRRKPLLRAVYADFYRRLQRHFQPSLPGRVVEIGSGIGNLHDHFPTAIRTDLFPNPWLDLTCDAYELPWCNDALSHLFLVDVFHHLEAPRAFLHEAQRVLVPRGRLVILDPFISWFSYPVYGWFHHEPVAWSAPIRMDLSWPRPRNYYAAQGNATRIFFRDQYPECLLGWKVLEAEVMAGFAYLLSGGFSGPSLAPATLLPLVRPLDAWAARWPRCFGVRCLVCLERRAD